MNPLRWLVLFSFAAALNSLAGDRPSLKLAEARRIWDQAPHSAFTDMVRFKGRFICAFREGKGHVSPEGALRLIESSDGREWRSAALLRDSRGDLRDPKLSITPDNRLMLIGAIAFPKPAEVTHRSLAWFSDDGRDWSEPVYIGEPNIWLWRAAWRKGNCYGVGYAVDGRELTRLYKSENGKNFEVLVPELFSKAAHGKGYPNEAALLFENNTAWCLLRRDADSGSAQLGQSSAPYKDWQWRDLGIRIGGPQMIRLPSGEVIAAARLYDGGARTSLIWVDLENAKLDEALKLPSGGDTSYPGLVWHGGALWVSYYSSHEGKTAIYLARVELEE